MANTERTMVSFRISNQLKDDVKKAAAANGNAIQKQYEEFLSLGATFNALVQDTQKTLAFKTDLPWGTVVNKPDPDYAAEQIINFVAAAIEDGTFPV